MERAHSRVAALLVVLVVTVVSRAALAADAGLTVFIEKRCYTCHTIAARAAEVEKQKAAFIAEKGIDPAEEEDEEDGESRGGDLSDVGKKRSAEWLKEFSTSPKSHFKSDSACQREAKKKDRKKFRGTPEELDTLVSFLLTLKQDAKQAPGFTSCLKD